MLIADDWKDYELIDAGDGERLERWGKFILRRPDPQAFWPADKDHSLWEKAHAHYYRSESGGGHWDFNTALPDKFNITYNELRFQIKLTGFKHTGLFPEQSVNWKWIIEKIKKANRPIRVLNAFAYTGGATLAAAHAGAEVVHVDASKGVVTWAKENLHLSGMGERPVRFIVDDVFKFVQREHRRGRTYDAIIMDPPTYGRGPEGELWKLEDNFYRLLEYTENILSDKPLFILINTYVARISPTVLNNILALTLQKKYGGSLNSIEIGLPIQSNGLVLPAGVSGRWEA